MFRNRPLMDLERELQQGAVEMQDTVSDMSRCGPLLSEDVDIFELCPIFPVTRIVCCFGFGQAGLTLEMIEQVKRIAATINRSWCPLCRPITEVCVVGHTDNIGVPSQNVALGLNRAKAVRARLLTELSKLGLSGSVTVLPAQSCGQTRPRRSNATAAGRRLNRRVEVFLQPVSESVCRCDVT